MANPSILNGHIDIANELAEQFAKLPITGQEWRVLWVILRETWGYKAGNRKRDCHPVSSRHIERRTGIKRENARIVLASLASKNIILMTDQGYGLNQDYENWIIAKRPQRMKRDNGMLQTPVIGDVIDSLPRDATTSPPGMLQHPSNGMLLHPPSKIIDSIKDNIPADASRGKGSKGLQEHLTGLAVITLVKGLKFDNYQQLQGHIKRFVRASESLKGYSPEQILRAFFRAVQEAGPKWDVQVETVGRKIAAYKDWPVPSEFSDIFQQTLEDFEKMKDTMFTKSSPLICSPS